MGNLFDPIGKIKEVSTVIFDSDGVIVEEGRAIDGAVDLINNLNSQGKRVIVLSNNSTKHPEVMKQNYRNQGLMIDHVFNSSMITANYCRLNQIKRVFIVGEVGLIEVLDEEGIKYTASDVDAVIVGMDRDLTYDKLAMATRLILDGAKFIGTNPDKSFPTPRGLEPGAGSMIAALEASTGKVPDIIIGKPQKFGYEFIFNQFDIKSSDCLMIGDRYETDILGAINTDILALVVNTGIASTREEPGKFGDFPEVPVIHNLRELVI